jgi:hypothetical protein
MSTSLNDLPMPGNQMPQQMQEQQQFDLNSMIDEASKQQTGGNFQEDTNLSANALQYQLDSSQIPQHGPNPNMQMNSNMQEHYMQQGMEPMYEYEMEPEKELTLRERLTNEIKLPLIVAILFVVLSLPQFNQVLTRFMPRFLAETGELNMMGLLAKAFIIAILIFGIKFFI